MLFRELPSYPAKSPDTSKLGLIMDDLKGLIGLLPTPSTRWSALLTGVLLTPAFLAPPFLKPLLWPTATEKELLLLQLLASILVLLVGSLLVLVLILRDYKKQEIKHQKEIESIKTKSSKQPAPTKSQNPYHAQSWML